MEISNLGNNPDNRPTLLAVDGYSLMFRAYFAIPPMAGPSGPSNALFGFFRMLTATLKQFRPTFVAVALDHPSPTFRDELFAEYKGGRSPTPDELRFQLEAVRELLAVTGIRSVEVAGYEADDVIATLSRMAVEASVKTEIVTGDRDSLQLVEDPLVRVQLTRQGVSDLVAMDESAILEKYGVRASQYCDFAVLRGDKSDNLPGIRGIGPKTAAQLLGTYGSIDGIVLHRDELSPRWREAITAATPELPLFCKLALLERHVPLDVTLEDVRTPSTIDIKAAEEVFVGSFGLRTVVSGLREVFNIGIGHEDPTPNGDAQGLTRVVGTFEEVLSANDSVAIVAQFDGVSGREAPLVLGFGAKGESPELDVWLTTAACDAVLLPEIDQLRSKSLVGIGLKEIVRSLTMICGARIMPESMVDLGVLAYVLDASERRTQLGEVAQLLNVVWHDGDGTQLFESTARADLLRAELGGVPKLLDFLRERLVREGIERLVDEIEIPLVKVLTKMEIAGVAVDRRALCEIGAVLAAEAATTLDAIHTYTDATFNPNSPKQLGVVLFEELGLPTGKKTKTGYSTDARVLEGLRDAHPLVGLVLKFRELDKLRATFFEGLTAEIADDGRIHATYNQTVARTGRISSEHPNLQNIPVRSSEGRRFRTVFVAPAGMKLVAADYSQIELRILAHLSQDPGLIHILRGTGDVHAMVAASVYGVDVAQVTYEQRSVAKMVAYGLSYGMETYGLAQRLSITNEEADTILNAFFEAYPGIVRYREEVIREAREKGYTTTLLGRRRYLPELRSANRAIRQGAERQAMNAPTQGLAADIFKMALVALDQQLSETGARLVLQIHDEVVVEAPETGVHEVVEVVQDTLSSVISLDVPLVVNVGVGANWAEARA